MRKLPPLQKFIPKQLSPMSIALLYAAFAALWIIASGNLLTFAVDDITLQGHIEQAKGLAFVAVTSGLLYLLLKGWHRTLLDPTIILNTASRPLAINRLTMLFAALVLIVPLIGLAITTLYGPKIEREAYANLEAISKLKAEQIENWLDERQDDIKVLAASPGFVEHTDKYIKQQTASSREAIQKRLNLLRTIHGYDSGLLLDTNGQLLISAGEHDGMIADSQPLLRQSLVSKQVQRGDIYRDEAGNIHLDWVAPIFVTNAQGEHAVAVVVLRVTTQHFLFPLIQTWPTSSPSAETLLVRKDGEFALFINTLRHRDNTALSLHLPLTKPSYPAVTAILSGQAGITKGVDYRNIEVLTAYRPIKDTNWHLIAKIDRREVLAPLRELVLWVSLVALVAIITISIALLILWRQQHRSQSLALLTQKMKAEHELEIADVSLKESQVRNQSLIDAALDGVITMSEDGKVASWNPQATRIFGYSFEQALGNEVAELIIPPAHREAHRQGITRFIKTGNPTIINTRIEVLGKRSDDSEFPMELSISAIKQEKGYFFSAYVRDITERKKTEIELRKSERLLRDSQQAANIGCYIVNFETETWESTPTLNHLFGITEDYPHTIEGWVNLLHSDFADTLKDYFLEVMRDRKSFDAEYKIIRPSDRAERWMHGLGQIVYDEKNNTVSLVGTVQDITKRKEMLDALTVSENEFHSLAEAMPQIVWVTLADGCTIYINQRWVDYTGLTLEQSYGYDGWNKPFHPDDQKRAWDAWQNAVKNNAPYSLECQLRRADGTYRWWLIRGVPLLDENGKVYKWFGTCTDIHEIKQAENELRIAATAFESHEAMLITDANQIILKVNQAFTRITGYSAEEAIGNTPAMLRSGKHDQQFYDAMWKSLNRDKFWQGELWNRRKNGELYPEWLSISSVSDTTGQVSNYVAAFGDITAIKKSEETIHNLAFYDPLTNLPNRRLLIERLQQALNSSSRHLNHGAILFIDLDNFKELNDIKGYEIGDLLLVEVAKRLQLCARSNDTVACLGGDDFVVVLEDLSVQADQAAIQAENVAEKIRIAISQPFNLQGLEYHNASSIGISLFRNHEISVDDLLKHADTAMYQAKQSGRNTIRFFDPATHAAMEARIALEAELRLALPANQFQLYYQMQVNSTGKIVGAEVLIRWQHPERGLVPPIQFIPLTEENGMIVPIGDWVLETACAQIKRWETDINTRHLQLAVNVSALQFRQPDFVEQVCGMLEKTAINPGNLKLELTETLVLEDVNDTITKIQALKKLGVHFSMDDFGTGYSSLAYLSKLPLDQLKIDQSFVYNIDVQASDAVIVQTIIGMAKNLDMEVIAEGVETEQQRDFLERNGCTHFQGYLFSKPVPLEEFELLLGSNLNSLAQAVSEH